MFRDINNCPGNAGFTILSKSVTAMEDQLSLSKLISNIQESGVKEFAELQAK